MSYVFDSSSIFRAIKQNAVDAVAGSYTLEVARYELGNTLWKEYAIHRRVNSEEVKRLTRPVKDVLKLMEVMMIGCHEEEIIDTSVRLKLTFYDASYVHFTEKNNIPLVTEDLDLIEKVKAHVKALKLDDIL